MKVKPTDEINELTQDGRKPFLLIHCLIAASTDNLKQTFNSETLKAKDWVKRFERIRINRP